MDTFVNTLAAIGNGRQLSLLGTIVGAFCSGLFALLCWLVKFTVRRELDRMDKFRRHQDERYEEFRQHREWIITVLAMHRLIPEPLPPTYRDD